MNYELDEIKFKFNSEYSKIRKEVSENGLLLEKYKDTVYATIFELVCIAVNNNGNALEYASYSSKNRLDVVVIAFVSNEESLQYATARIKKWFEDNPDRVEYLNSLRVVNLKPAK